MLENQRPNDPLAASQFGVAAMVRYILPQYIDASQGVFRPEIAGTFLRVEHVDFAARISFNNQDFNQSIALIPGQIIDGDFSGVTIWHENFAAFGNTKASIILDVGRNTRMEVDSQASKCGLPLPISRTFFGATGCVYSIMAPSGYKKLDFELHCQTTAGALPFTAIGTVAFIDIDGNTIGLTAGNVTRNKIIYAPGSEAAKLSLVTPVQIGATAYAFQFNVSDLPVPTVADSIRVSLAYNVTSSDLSRLFAIAK